MCANRFEIFLDVDLLHHVKDASIIRLNQYDSTIQYKSIHVSSETTKPNVSIVTAD